MAVLQLGGVMLYCSWVVCGCIAVRWCVAVLQLGGVWLYCS